MPTFTKINLIKNYTPPWYAQSPRVVRLPQRADRSLMQFYDLLLSGDIILRLDPAYKPDRELLTGDKLGLYPHLWKAYVKKFSPLLIQAYELCLSKDQRQLPANVYEGFQGMINATILFKYVLENKCGLKMDEKGRQIDPRLFSIYQKDFLNDVIGERERVNWDSLISAFKLNGARNQVALFEGSVGKIFEYCYPWAFNLSTPEGHHLHPWDFTSRNMWAGPEGKKLAVIALRHVFEKHLGFVMDKTKKSIDPRFFPGKYIEFLNSQNLIYAETTKLLEKYGIGGVVAGCKDFLNKYVDAFMAAWPWAFDLSTSEGHHLHQWDFFGKGYRERNSELAFERCKHVLEKHLGLKMNEKTLEIDERLFEKGSKQFLKAAGYEDWGSFFAFQGLRSALIQAGVWCRKTPQDKDYNVALALQELYPWAFNLGQERHLHFWEILTEHQWTDNEIKIALRHRVREKGIRTSMIPKKVSREWLIENHFGGALDRFGNNRLLLLKHVFEGEFQRGTLRETMFKNLKMRKGDPPPMREVKEEFVFDTRHGRILIDGRKYILPAKTIGIAVRILAQDLIGIFADSEIDKMKSQRKYKLVAAFRVSSQDKKVVFVNERDMLIPGNNLLMPDPDLFSHAREILKSKGINIYDISFEQQLMLVAQLKSLGKEGFSKIEFLKASGDTE